MSAEIQEVNFNNSNNVQAQTLETSFKNHLNDNQLLLEDENPKPEINDDINLELFPSVKQLIKQYSVESLDGNTK